MLNATDRSQVFTQIEDGLQTGACLVVALNFQSQQSEPFRSTGHRGGNGEQGEMYNPWCNTTYSPNFAGLSDFLLREGCVTTPDIDVSHTGIRLPNGNRVYTCQDALDTLSALTPFERLQFHREGIQREGDLREAIDCTSSGACQVHHLVERRFDDLFELPTDQWLTMALTSDEHQVFTNSWRAQIPLSEGTRNATRNDVIAAANVVYADYPEILTAMSKEWRNMG